MARRHEQAIAIAAAEAEVGAALGQRDVADGLALRIEDAHAVELIGHAPATPQIAVDVAAKAVRRTVRARVDQHLAVRELAPVADHVTDENASRLRARFDDVE